MCNGIHHHGQLESSYSRVRPIAVASTRCQWIRSATHQIPISAVGGLYVRIYHIGYAPYKVKYTDDKPVRIELEAKAEYLGEAIVTQQYSKRSVNKAVEKVNIINSKQIQNMAAVSYKVTIRIPMRHSTLNFSKTTQWKMSSLMKFQGTIVVKHP